MPLLAGMIPSLSRHFSPPPSTVGDTSAVVLFVVGMVAVSPPPPPSTSASGPRIPTIIADRRPLGAAGGGGGGGATTVGRGVEEDEGSRRAAWDGVLDLVGVRGVGVSGRDIDPANLILQVILKLN